MRVHSESGLLSKGHGILHGAMLRKLTHIRGQERGHVARRRIDLAGARPLENSRLLTGRADRLAQRAVTLYGAATQAAWQRQCGRAHPEGTSYPLAHQGCKPRVKTAF